MGRRSHHSTASRALLVDGQSVQIASAKNGYRIDGHSPRSLQTLIGLTVWEQVGLYRP